MNKGHMNPGVPMPHFQAQPNFLQKQVVHNGFNPIHQQRIAKDFSMQKPHVNPVQAPQGAAPLGQSPWLMMGGK